MINRRSFLKSTSGAAMASAAMAGLGKARDAETLPQYLVDCVTFRLHSGAQMGNALAWLEKRAMPLWEKHGFGPVGVFTVDVGEHLPAVLFLRVYSSLADRQLVWSRLSSDPAWKAAVADLEKEGPAFFREDSMLLLSTSFSPPIKPAAPGDPAHALYELRIYESPTWRQLEYLHERFAGGEIDVFHKSGIHPVLYADTLIGPNQPNMIYLIPFESPAQREKAWQAFRDHPDWIKLREDSIRRGGEIVRNIKNMILAPTSFSMLR
ncbi:MAG: NIPSNAP family protein [Acidobacteriia bacterium]|nr:NIPSNAP family protein [Terriglobia bacterium]